METNELHITFFNAFGCLEMRIKGQPFLVMKSPAALGPGECVWAFVLVPHMTFLMVDRLHEYCSFVFAFVYSHFMRCRYIHSCC